MAFTNGEVRALIGPVLGENPEDMDHFIIIAQGKCRDCGARDGTTVLHTFETLGEFLQCLEYAVHTIRPDDFSG